MKTNLPATPKALSRGAASIWRKLVSIYEFDEGGLIHLRKACEFFTKADEAEKVLDAEGFTYIDAKGQPKLRPEFYAYRDLTAYGMRFLQKTGINLEPVGEVGRPAGSLGIKISGR